MCGRRRPRLLHAYDRQDGGGRGHISPRKDRAGSGRVGTFEDKRSDDCSRRQSSSNLKDARSFVGQFEGLQRCVYGTVTQLTGRIR